MEEIWRKRRNGEDYPDLHLIINYFILVSLIQYKFHNTSIIQSHQYKTNTFQFFLFDCVATLSYISKQKENKRIGIGNILEKNHLRRQIITISINRMSTSDDKANAKPFDSDYYKWSYGISESRKVSVFRFSNH